MKSDIQRALLRRFEPVIHFTHGEQFFPMGVEPYIDGCSLWVQRPDHEPVQLISAGRLSLQKLAEMRFDIVDGVYFLKYIDPLSAAEMATAKLRSRSDDDFRVGNSRLARVGYISRLADAFFSLALLTRGRVPGDTASAAAITYRAQMAQLPSYRYYGRVVEHGQWTVLQYWYFYAYNNWRSRFSGANDHEADWEMVCIYLSEEEVQEGTAPPPPTEINGAMAQAQPSEDVVLLEKARTLAETVARYSPEWAAYAFHDYEGDDLRRRWDDPEIQKFGEHPIIFSGAGSHASYFSAGEYLTEIELSFFKPLVRVSETVQRFWRQTLRQYASERIVASDQISSIFRIPFVDYARGDGLTLGPGQDVEWNEPGLLEPIPAWVSEYRGLWGLYTRDPFNGEDAPAGPMYDRGGQVRRAWYDPVGWAGLDKITPFGQALEVVLAQQAAVRTRQAELMTEAEMIDSRLTRLGIQFQATREHPHLVGANSAFDMSIQEYSAKLASIRAEMADNNAIIEALDQHALDLRAGKRGPLRAHLRRAPVPTSEHRLRLRRLAEFWAAISVGLLLLIMVGVVYFVPAYLGGSLVAIVSLFMFVEAGFRGRLLQLVTSVALTLAVISSLVLIYHFFWQIVVILALIAGAYILLDNLGELGQ